MRDLHLSQSLADATHVDFEVSRRLSGGQTRFQQGHIVGNGAHHRISRRFIGPLRLDRPTDLNAAVSPLLG